MAINTEKLEELIDERSSKIQVARQIGIDRSTFYRKIKGEGKGFSIDEAQKIVEAVPLTNQEAIEIFFGNKVAKTLLVYKKEKEEVG